MNDSTKDDQKDGTNLNEQELQALETILRRTVAFEQYRSFAQKLERISQTKKSSKNQRRLSDLEAEAKVWLDTVKSAEAAGVLHPSYRFLLTLYPIERVHDERWVCGWYESDLCDIKAGLDAIREIKGLGDDEDCTIGERPEDWEELEQQYSEVLDRKFEEALREFGLHEIADLYHTDRDAFDAQREQGRRLALGEISDTEQIDAAEKLLEIEAEECAKAGAYYAATVMIGSALEAALLFACLKRLDEALSARNRLPKSERPDRENPKRWRFVELARIANEAGWLPDFVVGDRRVCSRSLMETLRRLRNLAHPSRHLTDAINRDIKSEYANARAAYNLLKRHLAEPGGDAP